MDKDSVMQKKKIFLSSPTMHGEERKFVEEAFDTCLLYTSDAADEL